MSATLTPTFAAYHAAFEQERLQRYPVVDAFEKRMGHQIYPGKLLTAARALACPLKTNTPNWQHGRVLYAATSEYLYRTGLLHVSCLDIGTAKGFSALCMLWAMDNSGVNGTVTSVDVIDPNSRERRNSILECTGPKNLYEVLDDWPEHQRISFYKSTGQKWLQEHTDRVHVAFIDGKHSYEVVSWEVALLAQRQQSGDLAMFDDVQIAGVAKALKEQRAYDLEYLEILPNRKYAIGRRK